MFGTFYFLKKIIEHVEQRRKFCRLQEQRWVVTIECLTQGDLIISICIYAVPCSTTGVNGTAV